MKKTLILGGSYFIGKAIAERLARETEVTLLNRGSKPAPEGVRQIVCDRNDAAAMKAALRGRHFDYVIDVCGLNQSQAEILADSLDRTALRCLIFISSSAVYDAEHLTIPFKESDPLAANRFWTCYGTDKIAAEAAYWGAFAQTNVSTVFLRPPYVYGENNYARRESFVFNHLLDNRPIIIPAANPKLQFIYAPDLADTVAALLGRLETLPKNAVFNVGNRRAVTCREWVEACGRAAGIQPTILSYDYASDRRNVRDFFPFFDYDNVLDVSAMKAIAPEETPFEEGLRNAFAWFQSNRDDIRFDDRVTANEQEILKKLR